VLPRSVVKMIALRMPRFRGAPARVRPSLKQQAVVRDLCAEENARLEAEFRLGLDRYGYCLPNRSPAKS
jgi:hypothetical protein